MKIPSLCSMQPFPFSSCQWGNETTKYVKQMETFVSVSRNIWPPLKNDMFLCISFFCVRWAIMDDQSKRTPQMWRFVPIIIYVYQAAIWCTTELDSIEGLHLIHLMLCLENTNYVAIIKQTFKKKVGTDFQLLNCCVFVGGSGVKVLVGHVGQMIFCASLFPANESDAAATVIRRLPLLLSNKLWPLAPVHMATRVALLSHEP